MTFLTQFFFYYKKSKIIKVQKYKKVVKTVLEDMMSSTFVYNFDNTKSVKSLNRLIKTVIN